ncbi:MAG: hypothetical protein JXR03_18320 [Cyclobacteriaceae bacterium]
MVNTVEEQKSLTETYNLATKSDELGEDYALKTGAMTNSVNAAVALNIEIKAKAEKDKELLHILSAAEQAYNDLMDRLGEHLDRIDAAMRDLEIKMAENRRQWEIIADRLDAVDDLLEDVRGGKDLDVNKATAIVKKAGKNAPEDESTADYLVLLNQIKTEDCVQIAELDNEYGVQSVEYGNLEHDKEIVEAAQRAVDDVANNNDLSDEQKEIEYSKINEEYGNSNFFSATMKAGDPDSDMVASSEQGYAKEMETTSFEAGGLNF